MSRMVQMIMFLIVATLILLSVHYYLYLRMVRDTGVPLHLRWIPILVLGVAVLSMPLIMILARGLSPQTAKWVTLGPYYWMAIFFLLFTFLLAGDALRLVWWGLEKVGALPEPWSSPSVSLWTHRIVAGLSLVGAVGLTVYGAVHQALGPDSVRHEVRLKGVHPDLEGFRIVQLSDLHIGPTLGREWLQKVVQQANAERPDVIVITGDLVDGTPEQLGPELAPLAELSAPFGIFFVTGNHEYYSGAPEWIEFLTARGIRVLRNQHVVLQSGSGQLCLAGVNDLQGASMFPEEGSSPAKAIDGCPTGVPTILLAHDPRSVTEAAKAHVDLVLSGHTHGGQFWPWTWMVLLQQANREGFYRHGETQLYVTPGTGYWGPPVRLGTTGEITRFEILADTK